MIYPSPTCGKGKCPELSCPSCPATPTIQELGTKDAVTRGRAVFLKDGDGYMKATSADQGTRFVNFSDIQESKIR